MGIFRIADIAESLSLPVSTAIDQAIAGFQSNKARKSQVPEFLDTLVIGGIERNLMATRVTSPCLSSRASHCLTIGTSASPSLLVSSFVANPLAIFMKKCSCRSEEHTSELQSRQ